MTIAEGQPAAPSPAWRMSSSLLMGGVGVICRSFLLALNKLEVHGLDRFVKLLDERADVQTRERGLITVSNHLSVLDDPLMWGVIPFKYHFSPNSLRWALGSHDIVFKNRIQYHFFTFGQTLPTHRLAHSKYGGLFQPTITQSIRLLSRYPFTQHHTASDAASDISDPFSDSALTYTTDNVDSIPAPSAYASRMHSWIHVFPEGRTHQHPDKLMRYFKWGVSRLILEAEPAPLLVPIWIEGFEQIMHESRKFPRFVPRGGKKVHVVFGDVVETEGAFGDLRERWQRLVEQEKEKEDGALDGGMGFLTEELKFGEEAVKLREECTMRVREEVLKLRRLRGWPDEDPKARLVDTWKEEGKPGKREGKMDDGSWVKDV